MIYTKRIVFNPVQVNCYLVYDETGECVVIDPAMSNASENKIFTDTVGKIGLKPVRVLLTHAHFDHVLGSFFIKSRYGLSPEGCKDDEFMLEHTKEHAAQFGFPIDENPPPLGNHLKEGDKVLFGNSELNVIHLPGHSPGSLLYYNDDVGFLISGDVLFSGSVGRSDLAGGNHEQLITGIKKKLLTLPDTTIVRPGHGRVTNIKYEKDYNPFLRQTPKAEM